SDLNMFQTVKTVDNEIEVLRSRDLISKVLKDLKLETSYIQKIGFKTKELYGENRPIVVEVHELNKGAYGRKIEVTPVNEKLFKLSDSTVNIVASYGQLIKNNNYTIRVEQGPAFTKNYETINIQFKDLYKLTEAYRLMKLSIVNIIGRNTIEFIGNRLKSLVSNMTVAEHNVQASKQRHQIPDLQFDTQMIAARSVEYNQSITKTTPQLTVVKPIENYFISTQ